MEKALIKDYLRLLKQENKVLKERVEASESYKNSLDFSMNKRMKLVDEVKDLKVLVVDKEQALFEIGDSYFEIKELLSKVVDSWMDDIEEFYQFANEMVEKKSKLQTDWQSLDHRVRFLEEENSKLSNKNLILIEENKNLNLKSVSIQGSSLLTPEETSKKSKDALMDIANSLEESDLFEAEEKILKENKYRIKKNGNGIAGVKQGCTKIECYKQSENSEPQYVVGELRTRDVYKAMEESASPSYVKGA
ncbi:MAG: hypothetical protein HY818_05315 [Acetobacterium woodii]|nr:hypothetical protein [Acetobacterium woodii]